MLWFHDSSFFLRDRRRAITMPNPRNGLRRVSCLLSSTCVHRGARPWAPPLLRAWRRMVNASGSRILPNGIWSWRMLFAGIKGMRRIGKMGSHTRNHLYVHVADSLLPSRNGKLIKLFLKLRRGFGETMSHAVGHTDITYERPEGPESLKAVC